MAPPYVQQGPYGTAWQPDDQSLYVLPPEAIIPPDQTQYVDPAGALPPPVVEPVAAVPPPAPPVVEVPPVAPVEAVPVSEPVAAAVAPPIAETASQPTPAAEPAPVAEPTPVVDTPWGQYGVTDAGQVISPDGLPVTDPKIREAVAAEAQARNQERVSRLATEAANQERALEKERNLILAKARESEEIEARSREELIVKSGEVVTDVSKRIADYDINAPERPGWKKALALISVAMSGIGMALNRQSGPNPALEILMRGAQEEAQARRATYEKLLGGLGMAKDEQTRQLMRAKSAKEAYHTSEAAVLDTYTRMADQIAKRSNTEKERINGLSVAARLRESTAEAQRKAAIERAEQTRKETETEARIANDKASIYLAGKAYKLNERKFESDEESKKYARENPDPEKQLARVKAAAETSGLKVVDPIASGDDLFFKDAAGNDIIVPDADAKAIKLASVSANSINQLIAKQRGLIKALGAGDKALLKLGGQTEVVRLLNQNAAEITKETIKGNGFGALDDGAVRLARDLRGGDQTEWLASAKTLDNLVSNLESSVNSKIQGTGLFGNVRTKNHDGSYAVGPRAYKMPNLVIDPAGVDLDLSIVNGRYWGREDGSPDDFGVIIAGQKVYPDGNSEKRQASRAEGLKAMANLVQQARSGEPDKLLEVARSAGPMAKKAARGHLMNLAVDPSGMSEEARKSFKARLAREKWFKDAE